MVDIHSHILPELDDGAKSFEESIQMLEIAAQAEQDILLRLHFDGGFQFQSKGVIVAASEPDVEKAAQEWLRQNLAGKTDRKEVADVLLQAWWCIAEKKSFTEATPGEAQRWLERVMPLPDARI